MKMIILVPCFIFCITLFPKLTLSENVCDLPLLTGPCKGDFQRYGYDASKRKCVTFTYGGCQGNGNNFKTEEECKAKCSADCSNSKSSFLTKIAAVLKNKLIKYL
ncbi:U-actitoxin-Avd3m-like [Leptopilina heterotoma]|uniref:U-actitoxin-Avd3m-like n=1 Tax=Leptopilina heterotoma TaxID=63436 RepID=UPI001CA97990|nr:U-actitoxin-Avd3m-like [Leptopilina heterotoma]